LLVLGLGSSSGCWFFSASGGSGVLRTSVSEKPDGVFAGVSAAWARTTTGGLGATASATNDVGCTKLEAMGGAADAATGRPSETPAGPLEPGRV
jgi:hypothetical protein